MARSPSPGSDLDSQSVASRISFEPSLAQGSWDPAKTQGRDFAKGVLVLSCGVRTRARPVSTVRFAARGRHWRLGRWTVPAALPVLWCCAGFGQR